MRTTTREQTAAPQQTYHYVQGLLRVDEENDQANYEQAVGVCFNYLIQKKMQWSIYLQKIVQLFLDLAFKTNKHTKIKQVLKNYRSVTQNQHPDSLKSILEYYRDNKLHQILHLEILKNDLNSIKSMRSIQDDQLSSEIIISTFNPAIKNQKQQIRTNLRIVWEGYKAIVDTVRFNHKLQGVYRQTLQKIFQFVQLYNRKYQFKNFCQYSRSGLRNVMNKRGDKTQQQKGFYIDIQKQQVNTNNIKIRLQQFNLTTKLGLWQQAFQILQDINQIMKVRKGPLKNSLKCPYFQNLATIFKKSYYWHYHAYAFFNYYSIYITKSKLPIQQKVKVADKLILSVLCIPPSTIQNLQSKQSQQKIASMMVSGSKIPSKQQLQQMMISRGVVQNASPSIKQFWYFMFLDFDLSSLAKGLKLLQNISKSGQYKQFIQLLQDILIYKQLISISQVYQRIKYASLLSIIPLPKQKIQKVLLQCHHRKVIDFVLDQKQGIIIFFDQLQQTNPYQQFLSCFTDIALLHQQTRKYDRNFIINKTINFINTADDYYNNIRGFKIDEYKKKLKKPRQQLDDKYRQLQKKQQDQKKQKQNLKKIKQAEQKQKNQQKKRIFIQKKVRINQIIILKQNRIVKIGNKRIQNLTDDQIKQMDKQIFQQGLKQITTRVANDNQNRNKKRYTKIDYLQRQRRSQLKTLITTALQTQQNNQQKIKQLSKTDHQQRQKLKQQIQKIAPQVKIKIDEHYTTNKKIYQQNMNKFKDYLTAQFKKKIIKKARQLYDLAQKKKAQQQQKRIKQQRDKSDLFWRFKPKINQTKTTQSQDLWKRKQKPTQTTQDVIQKKDFPALKSDTWARKGQTAGLTTTNTFAQFRVDDDEDQKKQIKFQKKQQSKDQKPKQKKQQKDQKKDDKWNIGIKQKQQQDHQKQQKKQQSKQQLKQQQKQQQSGWIFVATKKNKQPQSTKAQLKKFIPPPVPTDTKDTWGKIKTNLVDVNAQTTKPKDKNINSEKKKGRAW